MPQPIPSMEDAPKSGATVLSDDLAAVCEIAELASRASSLDELFAVALDRCLRLTQIEMGAVVLLDPAGRFDLRVQRGLPEAVLSQIQGAVPPKNSLPALAIEQCQLMVAYEAATDPRELASLQQLGIRTHVCIPLQVGRRALGLLGLASYQEHHFSPQRREMFTAAGAVIGLAIENARALEAVALRAEQLALSLQEANEALETRKLVERAKGVLMRRAGLGEAEAFRRLQRLSTDRCQPMKQTALQVLAADGIFPEKSPAGPGTFPFIPML
jgi:transcriptional regulator with GAF, ATPase, and Fis domain